MENRTMVIEYSGFWKLDQGILSFIIYSRKDATTQREDNALSLLTGEVHPPKAAPKATRVYPPKAAPEKTRG